MIRTHDLHLEPIALCMWIALPVLFLLAPLTIAAHTLEYISTTKALSGGAEIVSYDARTNRLYTTSSAGIDCYILGDDASLQPIRTIDFSSVFGVDETGQPRLKAVSSAAIDPAHRGFGAATAIPTDSTRSVGVLVLFDVITSEPICKLAVGYHPDMVGFSPNGAYLLVANEGEAKTINGIRQDPEGSVSVIDLRGKMINDLESLTSADVKTINFAPGNLDQPSDLLALRIDPANRYNLTADLEPEYIAFANGRAYVSLQENNAVGVLDLHTLRWAKLIDLGGIEQVIDASDKDGLLLDDRLYGLPMPDTISAFEHQGRPYFVTANEGDPRSGVQDEGIRIGKIPLNRFDHAFVRRLNTQYNGNFQAENALGRLKVSILAHDSDTNGDGKIDRLVMYGTRSFAIYEGETGNRIYDSGSAFAKRTAEAFPDQFNGQDNDPANIDSRSDDRGCEPEGLAIAEINGKRLCAIGLERVGGVMLYDLTDPSQPVFLQYIHSALMHASASSRPEGMTWIKPRDTADGKAYLVVAYEASGTIDVFGLKYH